jgi:hypothetical protein
MRAFRVPSLGGLTQAWRGRAQATLEHTADVIKESLLDWCFFDDSPDPEAAPEQATEPLPPLDREAFVQGMRGRFEEALADVALVLEEAPTGKAIADSEERIGNLLADLVWDAVATGLQMRSDAAAAERLHPGNLVVPAAPRNHLSGSGLPAGCGSQLHWDEKYRRMRAAALAARLAHRAQRRSADD